MEPEGSKSAALVVPLRTCSSTGTFGGTKATPLIVRFLLAASYCFH